MSAPNLLTGMKALTAMGHEFVGEVEIFHQVKGIKAGLGRIVSGGFKELAKNLSDRDYDSF